MRCVRYHSTDASPPDAIARDHAPAERAEALAGCDTGGHRLQGSRPTRRLCAASGPHLVRSARRIALEAFLVSLSTVAIAEIGDRTQILALMLAARFRKPWPILAGILCSTLANHALAALVGVHVGELLKPSVRDGVVGASLILMALWALKADRLQEGPGTQRRTGAFGATLVTFFVAEMGDKTQIATMALAAAYSNLAVVVAGTTSGMMVANTPVVLLGRWFSERLPLKAIHYAASAVFLALGVLFVVRAVRQGT
jgi:Ca2+/H+ antiporter, TMEM165/GDT1 family